MMMISRLLLLVVAVCGLVVVSPVTATAQDQPVGFRSILNKVGYQEILDIVIPIANSVLSNLVIPDFAEDVKVPVIGKVSVTVSNIDVAYVELGTGIFSSAGPNLIEFGFQHANAKVTANFKWKEHSFPHISDHGSLEAKSKDGGMDIKLALGVSDQGDVVVTVQDITVGFKEWDLSFSKHWDSWIYNMFTDIFEGPLTKAINSAIQQTAQTEVPALFDQLMAEIPKQITIGGGKSETVVNIETFSVNVTDAAISVANGLVMMNFLTNETCPLAYPAIPDSVPGSEGAAQLMAGNTIFNCPLWVMYTNGAIKYTDWSTTKAWKPYIPELYTAYPDAKLKLVFDALSAPVVDFDVENGATVDLSVSMKQLVDMENGSDLIDADTIQVDGQVAMKLTIEQRKNDKGDIDNVLDAAITNIGMHLKVLESNIGEIDTKKLNLASELLGAALQKIIDEVIKNGFVIPMIPDIILVNPEISYFPHYLAVDSSFGPAPAPNVFTKLAE